VRSAAQRRKVFFFFLLLSSSPPLRLLKEERYKNASPFPLFLFQSQHDGTRDSSLSPLLRFLLLSPFLPIPVSRMPKRKDTLSLVSFPPSPFLSGDWEPANGISRFPFFFPFPPPLLCQGARRTGGMKIAFSPPPYATFLANRRTPRRSAALPLPFPSLPSCEIPLRPAPLSEGPFDHPAFSSLPSFFLAETMREEFDPLAGVTGSPPFPQRQEINYP